MLPIISANSCMVLCIVRLILGSLYSLSWCIVRGVALWTYSKWVSLCPTADCVLIDLGGCLIVYSILVCFQVCSWTLRSTTIISYGMSSSHTAWLFFVITLLDIPAYLFCLVYNGKWLSVEKPLDFLWDSNGLLDLMMNRYVLEPKCLYLRI